MNARLQTLWNYTSAYALLWFVTLALMLEDDVAMLATMFS
jgi:hypothetical protein